MYLCVLIGLHPLCWQWYGQISTHICYRHHIISVSNSNNRKFTITSYTFMTLYYSRKKSHLKCIWLLLHTHRLLLDDSMNKLTQLLLALSRFLFFTRYVCSSISRERREKKRYILISNHGATLRTKVHLEKRKKSHFPINRENAHWNSSNQSQLQSLFITSMCFHLSFTRIILNFITYRASCLPILGLCVWVGPFHIHFEYTHFFFFSRVNERKMQQHSKWNQIKRSKWTACAVQLASMKKKKNILYMT